MTPQINPAAPHWLPSFITAPGETDTLMVVTGIFLILIVLAVGLLFWRLHTLPERIAHKRQKLQFEIVAILGLLSLFTHMHIFWVIGLFLALVEIPDFGGTFRRMAASLEKLAGIETREDEVSAPEHDLETGHVEPEAPSVAPSPHPTRERIHA